MQKGSNKPNKIGTFLNTKVNPVVLNCAAITFIRDVTCGVSACTGLKQGKSDLRCTTRKMLQPAVTAKGRWMMKGIHQTLPCL